EIVCQRRAGCAADQTRRGLPAKGTRSMNLFRRRSFRPGIRLQVLCWYTAVFRLVLLLAGAISYHYVETALENNVDTSLQLQAQQIAEEIAVGDDTITIHDATGSLSGITRVPAHALDTNTGALVRLLDPQGHLLRGTPASCQGRWNCEPIWNWPPRSNEL